MACPPCEKARAAAARAAKERRVAGVVKMVAVGAAAMVGVVSKATLESVAAAVDANAVDATNVKRYGDK